jgi:hypothetical protein
MMFCHKACVDGGADGGAGAVGGVCDCYYD